MLTANMAAEKKKKKKDRKLEKRDAIYTAPRYLALVFVSSPGPLRALFLSLSWSSPYSSFTFYEDDARVRALLALLSFFERERERERERGRESEREREREWESTLFLVVPFIPFLALFIFMVASARVCAFFRLSRWSESRQAFSFGFLFCFFGCVLRACYLLLFLHARDDAADSAYLRPNVLY